MNRYAVIATHHKAGTVWMNHTFRKIAEALAIPIVNIGRDPVLAPEDCAPPIIFCASNSATAGYHWLRKDKAARFLHVIRDPRDVVISSMHYHRTAPEKWLHRPNDQFGGRTYQQALNDCAADADRYLFEMDHSSGGTARAMGGWNYARPNSFEARYENLMEDVDTTLFAAAAAHLGFDDDEVATCRQVFWDHALFGGKAKRRDKIPHVRSGAPRQWEGVFDRQLGEAFTERFPGLLVQLGYEPDDAWVARLPDQASA